MSENTALFSTVAGWRFDNSYARLPELFHSRVNPEPVHKPGIVVFNRSLATRMGLKADELDSERGAAIFAGNAIPDGAEPLAQAYAGHQFGHFTMLGDGRAILLGEHLTPGGKRFDVQLKGSGRTPFSRRGDGRAALGPMLREYLISEAMHALGIPTTRSLAVATTGQVVHRDDALPGAVLTRIAASHIRVGTFEYAAAKGDIGALRGLADHTLQRHYPEMAKARDPYRALLEGAIDRQAKLIAQWLLTGFVHGVMNTDNMALSGETIDYGPCAFLDAYDPDTVFSSIDRNGRYAYGNQPNIAHWNLARLAESLLPLLDEDETRAVAIAKQSLATFPGSFRRHWLSGMRAKLGLFAEEDDDASLFEDLLHWMKRTRADYTNTFRNLAPEPTSIAEAELQVWHARWSARLARQPQTLQESAALMRSANPAIIPRNHNVEEALEAAVEKNDFSVMQDLLDALADPYAKTQSHARYRTPPPPGSGVYQTFCGT